MGRIWNGDVTVAGLFTLSGFFLYRIRNEYGVGLEYGGGITCRGSCSSPLIPHCMTRRADMKIQPYKLYATFQRLFYNTEFVDSLFGNVT